MEAIVEMPTLEIKINDVFRFRYDVTLAEQMMSPYHCFDGTLKAREGRDGSIILLDTYWSDNSSRWFTPEEAQKKGTLEFVCNLDEVDRIKKHETVYYDDDDLFVLHIHAGYRNEYYLRRGAKRSPAKMLATLNEREEEAHRKIRHAQDDLKEIAEKKAAVEAGDTSIYL